MLNWLPQSSVENNKTAAPDSSHDSGKPFLAHFHPRNPEAEGFLKHLRPRMTNLLTQRARSLSLVALLICGLQPGAPADIVAVRHIAGTIHGFLSLRSADGHITAAGDTVQVAHGDQITSHTVFTFKDGSIDDETAVYSQRRAFRLITYHHIQKGPSFPQPIDLSIDARSGQVTVRTTDKDGKQQVHAEHVDLPQDLANGIVPQIVENLSPSSAGTTVSMLVATPKPRVVKLAISSRGEENFSVEGASRKALHYEIKIEIGGVAGMVAPLVGKAPPNIEMWAVGGEAPTFLREQGPTYPDGPIMTIELTRPVWPDAPKAGI
jgi:hypothetical protein